MVTANISDNESPRLKLVSEKANRLRNFKQVQCNKTDQNCLEKEFNTLSPKKSTEKLSKKVTVDVRKVSQKDYLEPFFTYKIENSTIEIDSKKFMYRNSWSTYPVYLTNSFESLHPKTHISLRKCLSSPPNMTAPDSSSTKSKSPVASFPLGNFKNDEKLKTSIRNPLTNSVKFKRNGNFGQSTIRRRFLRSSMEMGIAKTLFTVVLTVTMTTFPFIGMTVYRIGIDEWSNSETTWFVVTMTILISNSFWNSIIYGARMPYFRQMIKRTWCRYFNEVRFCSKIMRSNVRQKT